MNKKTLFKYLLAVGVLSSTTFVGSHIHANTTNKQEKTIVAPRFNDEKKKLKVVTADELAPIPFEKVEKSKVKITKLYDSKIKHVIGKPIINAEKRPGGFAITTYYPTDIGEGELIVSQSVNEYGIAELLIEEARTWYPVEKGGYEEILIGEYKAMVHENDINFNTLHIFSDREIFTIAGQDTEYLLEVAQSLVEEIK